MSKPRSRSSLRSAFLLCVIIAAIIGPLAGLATGNAAVGAVAAAVCLLAPLVLSVPIWLTVFLPLIGFHELGHAIAGWASGMSLFAIRIWPLQLEIRPKRRLRWISDDRLLGFVQMWRLDGVVDLGARRKMVLGGPIGSIAGAFALCSLNLMPVPLELHPPLWFIGVTSLLLGITNLRSRTLPTGHMSDGRLLREIRENPVGFAALDALGLMQYLATRQVPIPLWPSGLQEAAQQSMEASHRYAYYSSLISGALYQGDARAAATWIAWALDESQSWGQSPEGSRSVDAMKALAAAMIALEFGQPETARRVLGDVGYTGFLSRVYAEAALAAIAAAEDDSDARQKHLQASEEAAASLRPKSAEAPWAEAFLTWIRTYLNSYDALPKEFWTVWREWHRGLRPPGAHLEDYSMFGPTVWGLMAYRELCIWIEIDEEAAIEACVAKISGDPNLDREPERNRVLIWSAIATDYALRKGDLVRASQALERAEAYPGYEQPALRAARAAVMAVAGEGREALRMVEEIEVAIDSAPDWLRRHGPETATLLRIRRLVEGSAVE